jgi:hypothetical protein
MSCLGAAHEASTVSNVSANGCIFFDVALLVTLYAVA